MRHPKARGDPDASAEAVGVRDLARFDAVGHVELAGHDLDFEQLDRTGHGADPSGTFASMDQQVVLITGASRGFGAAAARKIADRGHVVVATMRSPDRDGPAVSAGFEDRIEIVRLDVTDAAEVERVVAAAVERHGRIDVVVNNAGYGLYGPVECGREDQLWRQLDTNTFGPLRVARAVLPSMRARRKGKIVNVTSLSGRIVAPMLAHYAATKHALEALTEGLRFEVGELGVQVCMVEPGMFVSDWQTGNLDVAEGAEGAVYGELVATRLQAFRELAATRPGPASVAAALADIVDLQQPLPLRWPVGNDAVHQVPIRSSVSDEEWGQLCRSGALGPWRVPLHAAPPGPRRTRGRPRTWCMITGGFSRVRRRRRSRAGLPRATSSWPPCAIPSATPRRWSTASKT